MSKEKEGKPEKITTQFTVEVENRFGYRPPRAQASRSTEEKGYVPPMQERQPTSSDPKPSSSDSKTSDQSDQTSDSK